MTSTFEMQSQTSSLPIIAAHTAQGHQRAELPARIQSSYTTRFAAQALESDPSRFHLATGATVVPQAGDVVIARVTEILNHKRVETPESRKAILFEGAIIMLAYGNRYAADQFLAHVPDSLEPCHLVAAGGVAGMVTEQHVNMDDPTRIEPLGLLPDWPTMQQNSPFSMEMETSFRATTRSLPTAYTLHRLTVWIMGAISALPF